MPQDTIPFFQGYGDPETDWTALSYDRYERAIQDLIECARNVFFRDDLGEAIRSASARLFDEIFTETAHCGLADER